ANEILEDSEGLIWITTEDGLYLFDESTQSCKKIPDLPGRAVTNILEDHLHRLWISVWEKGIYVLDKYSFDILKSFEPVEGDSTSLLSKRIRTMYQDSENRIWAGDEYDNGLGLFRLNDSETGFIHYNSAPKASNYIFSNEIRFLAEDSENQLWVGTDGGLQRYDPANDRFQVYPDLINLPSITAYAIDAEGEFWLGTYSGGGLVRMRSEGSGIFGESKGLLHNDTGMSIHTRKLPVDHLGRIYYPTRRGLSVFDPKTETFQNYFEKEGFQPYATYYASMVTQDGDVWIGSENGLNRIQPNQLIEKDTTLPFVHITAVEILDSIYSAPDGKIFKQAVSFTDKIVLSHDQNDLAFEFVALHYAHPEENQYSWKLENRDDEWSKPSLERRVRYANLTPGTYTFRVKASNADGVWNEEGDFLQIVISPPWWTTWWAIAGLVLLFLVFVYLVYRYQLSSRLEHAENLRLKELDSVKSRLYTNITHEFRTPLTVINGMAEQIIEPEESRKMILRNSQHLLRLVNQMLDLAKLESGKLELNLVLGNIIAYLQYLVESFHSFAASKNIELVFYPEIEEFLMDYDEEKLQHIISNLISNAIKFSPEGSKIILHVSEDKTKDSEFLLIKVKDKGIGIAPDKLPHIFDRFYQVDDSSTRKGEGTGIGLTLTRELIHLMGGNITVESKVNAGTTFMVSLPVSRSAAPVTDIPRSEVSTMGLPVGRMAEDILTANEDFPVVLIIEDNPDVVFYIKTCLKDQYQIMTAENGALGIQKALDKIPDLIISDVMMPE
ncbi:MAG: hypothetical protein KDE26_17150, partial [Bacteroidetes bacterium]|nr:hypothetical protein [Bacteroidota bacterium]